MAETTSQSPSPAQTSQRSTHRFAMEPRLMYDAAGLISGLEGVHQAEAQEGEGGEPSRPLEATLDNGAFISATTLVFVDQRVADYHSLLGEIDPTTRVVLLAADRDGVEQITRTLAEYRDLSSVHIISHGDPGSLLLGSGLLNSETMAGYAQQLQQWSQAISLEGDLLLYGCDVAAGEAGQGFVQRLGALTGADIAASDDRSAAIAANGDWELEYHTGEITAAGVVDGAGGEGYQYALGLGALGEEFQVNTTTSASQETVAAAELEGGGFVTVWESNGQDGSYKGIYVQVFNTAGQPMSEEVQANTITTLDQSRPTVAALDGGGFVVTWQSNSQDSTYYDIIGQRFDALGEKIGDEFQVNTTIDFDQTRPAMTALTGGGFVVTWESYKQEADNYGVYGRIFDGSGNPVTGEFHVNTTIDNDQWVSSVSETADGFVVVWQSSSGDAGQYDVVGQRFDALGNPVGSEFIVNTLYTDGSQWNGSVAGLDNGGFVVSWNSNSVDDTDGSGEGVYAKIYAADGSVVRSEFLVNTYTTGNQQLSSVTAIRDGGFVVTWTSQDQDGSGFGIYGQQFDSTGTPSGGEFRVNTTTEAIQYNPKVISNGSSGYVAFWQSENQDGSGYGIYGQRYGFNNRPVLDNSTVPEAGVSIQGMPSPGVLIEDMLGGTVSDPDDGAVEGIAVFEVDSSKGIWQFSLDDGDSWQSITTPSETSALLLAANGKTRLRFIATTAGFTGEVDISYRAWDQNYGSSGKRVDITSVEAQNAISAAADTARAKVLYNPVPPQLIVVDAVARTSNIDPQSLLQFTSQMKLMEQLLQKDRSKLSQAEREQLDELLRQFSETELPPEAEVAEETPAEEESAPGEAAPNEGAEGEQESAPQGGPGNLAGLGENLSKQLAGQTHRTEAERQELAGVLQEIQGLLSCN